MTEKQANKITLTGIASWVFGGLFVLGGIASMATGKFGAGFFILLAGLAIFPPVLNELKKRFNLELSRWVKVGLVIVFLMIAGTMTPQGATASSTSTTIGSPSAQTQSLGQAVALQGHQINDTFEVGSLTVRVSKLRNSTVVLDRDFGSATRARTGAEYYIFDVSVTNNGKTSDLFYSGNLKVIDSQGREFDVAGGSDASGRIITDTDIQPGLSANYRDFYAEVPKDATGLVLAIYENGVWKTGREDVRLS